MYIAGLVIGIAIEEESIYPSSSSASSSYITRKHYNCITVLTSKNNGILIVIEILILVSRIEKDTEKEICVVAILT